MNNNDNLTIESLSKLIINKGATFTVNGTVINNGIIKNNGTIVSRKTQEKLGKVDGNGIYRQITDKGEYIFGEYISGEYFNGEFFAYSTKDIETGGASTSLEYDDNNYHHPDSLYHNSKNTGLTIQKNFILKEEHK